MTSNLIKALGLALKNDDLAQELLAPLKALNGDIAVVIAPDTATHAAATGSWSKTAKVKLVDSEGKTHKWANMTIASVVSASDTSSAGTATVGSANLVFTEGEATVTLNGSNHAWVAAETATLTVATLTILGYSVTGGTFVVTVV